MAGLASQQSIRIVAENTLSQSARVLVLLVTLVACFPAEGEQANKKSRTPQEIVVVPDEPPQPIVEVPEASPRDATKAVSPNLARPTALRDWIAPSILSMTLCAAKGISISRKGDWLDIDGVTRSVEVDRREEAIGIVNGISEKLTDLSAAQASEVRKCTEPYVQQLLNYELGP